MYSFIHWYNSELLDELHNQSYFSLSQKTNPEAGLSKLGLNFGALDGPPIPGLLRSPGVFNSDSTFWTSIRKMLPLSRAPVTIMDPFDLKLKVLVFYLKCFFIMTLIGHIKFTFQRITPIWACQQILEGEGGCREGEREKERERATV